MLVMERNATIPAATVTVFGLPLDYVVEAFTPSFAEMTMDELAFAHAEAEEVNDAITMAEIDMEVRSRHRHQLRATAEALRVCFR